VAGARTAPAENRDAVQQGLNSLVNGDKFPAALASVRDTQTFTAAVVLQLVGQGKIDLDASIERYLPNLVRGDGIDGRKITVRQLLQHTGTRWCAGLADSTMDVSAGVSPP
jgi:D-alanyl-D-alanine carboxypeptidase